jgi:hypothetical protein
MSKPTPPALKSSREHILVHADGEQGAMRRNLETGSELNLVIHNAPMTESGMLEAHSVAAYRKRVLGYC